MDVRWGGRIDLRKGAGCGFLGSYALFFEALEQLAASCEG